MSMNPIENDRQESIKNPSRRNLIASAAGAAAALTLGGGGAVMAAESSSSSKDIGANADAVRNGKLPQSVCQWCFKAWSIEELAENAQKIGLKGVDLVDPDAFETLKKHNLIGTMTKTHGITKGLNRKENWDECLGKIRKAIEATSAAASPTSSASAATATAWTTRRFEELYRGAQAGRRLRGGEEGHDLHGAAQQQGEPQGLHVRHHAVGREARRRGR
jgi:hypothetical protein